MVTVTQIYFDDRDATWKSFVEKAIAYDSMNNVTKELDAMGYIAGTGDTIAEKIATGYGMTYTYNLAGMRVTELDPESAALGLSWSMRYTYDALGRLIRTENIEGTIARTEYDLAGNIVRQTVRENASAPEQMILTATYDFAGNVLTQTDANGYTVTNTYNALNKLRSTTMPGDASIPSVTAYNQYNRSALVSSSWSTAGILQTYTYDNLGHLLSLSKSEVDGDRAITKYFRYDNNGNLVYGTDGNGNVTEFTYDAMNRVIFISQGGKTSTKTYDANGNQLTATDWLGNTITNVFDPLNRLIEKRDAYNLAQETYFYDESSRQIAAEDVYGRRTTYEYDHNNRLVRTTAPDGYTIAQTYDRRGNVVAQTDALGNTTHYAYDFLGRLVSVTDALDQTTTYTYDLKGNLLSQTDDLGNATYLEYNCRGLLLRKVSPGGRTGEPGAYIYDPTAVISYTYDALGNTATRTDRNGNTTVFEWDVHGNLLSQAIGTTEISYTYDNNGNVLTMTDALGTTTRIFDEFNRCVSKTVPFIGTSNYAYDILSGLPAGHVAETTTDPKGNTTLREYDRTGRLVRVTDTAADLTTHTVQYTYNDNGSVASVIYPDGAREDYTYTDGNLLETLINTLSDGTVLETYVYTYDLSRNLLTKQDAKGTTVYTYDPLGRVLTVTEPASKRTEYTYDAAGNRSTQTVTETGEDETVTVIRTTYTYDERNRLIQLQKHDISDLSVDPILLDVTDYTYDHSGNQLTTTRTTHTDGVAGAPVLVQSNTYDVWNQLVRTETENGTVVENAYNGDGRRVIKTVNGASTYYLYEYDKVILETNIYADVTGRNVYGLNLLIRTVGVDTFYYMYNGHADVTALLTPTGTVATSYYYDAFGNILEQTGDVSNSILFAGYQFDKETGLYYLNARMYDPVTARFMQEDTYAGQQQDPLSLNLYTYCHNSPLMYSDPTGHYAQTSQGIQSEIDRLYNTTQHNPGLFSQINALEAEKEKALQREEDVRKKEGQELTARYDNINSFVKDHPEFAEQDHVQSAMEAATYMGTYTYLSVMENNIANYTAYKPGDSYEDWENKQIKHYVPSVGNIPEAARREMEKVAEQEKRATEIKNRTNYATQRLLTYTDLMPETSYEGYLEPKIDLIAEVYAYTELEESQEVLFWNSLSWLGTPYEWVLLAQNQVIADCSAYARNLYMQIGEWMSLDTTCSLASQQMWKATNQNSKSHYIDLIDQFSEKALFSEYCKDIKQSSQYASLLRDDYKTNPGVVVYEYTKGDGVDGVDSLALHPFDVIFYNYGDTSGVSTHVGLVLGKDQYGQTVFIETATNSRKLEIIAPGHNRYNTREGQYTNSGGVENIVGVKRYLVN